MVPLFLVALGLFLFKFACKYFNVLSYEEVKQ